LSDSSTSSFSSDSDTPGAENENKKKKTFGLKTKPKSKTNDLLALDHEEKLVVIQSIMNESQLAKPLDEETILFDSNRKCLGKIFEVGSVQMKKGNNGRYSCISRWSINDFVCVF